MYIYIYFFCTATTHMRTMRMARAHRGSSKASSSDKLVVLQQLAYVKVHSAVCCDSKLVFAKILCLIHLQCRKRLLLVAS